MKETAVSVQVGAAAGLAGDLSRITTSEVALTEELREALAPAQERLHRLAAGLQALSSEAMRFATEMDFGFLMDKSRLLLSIGYEMERQHLHQACYDLLSSEARYCGVHYCSEGRGSATELVQIGTHAHHGLRTGSVDLLDGNDV